MKKGLVFALGLISLIIIGLLVYWYPIQKVMAENAIEKYMSEQGISEENIENKEIMKDYKQGGYYIDIELKDDPWLLYSYKWSPKQITLIVFKNNIEVEKGMKYPPLE